jgi:hypothetical protein
MKAPFGHEAAEAPHRLIPVVLFTLIRTRQTLVSDELDVDT